MYNPELKLDELFKSNSLRNMTTYGNSAMPHKGQTYYVWYDNNSGDESLIESIMKKGNKWGYGKGSNSINSINSYIDLSDNAHELISSRLIQYGPQSTSSSFTIRFVERSDSTIRITASGWGSSVIELYDGEKKYFLQYLLDHQKREDSKEVIRV